MIEQSPEGYRPCVGVLLLNAEGRIFVGERLDTPGAWQMPQGGIDSGEEPYEAALRELAEETGITSVEFLGISSAWRSYDLPENLSRKAWGGRYRGQAQIWVAFRFTDTDDRIDVRTADPEFRNWKWTEPDSLIEEIVEFKKDIYREIVDEFSELIASAPAKPL